MKNKIKGWLFDIYPAHSGVTLCFIDTNGVKHCCFRTFTPSFFLHVDADDARRAEVLGQRCPVPVTFQRTTRQELFSGEWREVVQVFVHDPMRFRQAVTYY